MFRPNSTSLKKKRKEKQPPYSFNWNYCIGSASRPCVHGSGKTHNPFSKKKAESGSTFLHQWITRKGTVTVFQFFSAIPETTAVGQHMTQSNGDIYWPVWQDKDALSKHSREHSLRGISSPSICLFRGGRVTDCVKRSAIMTQMSRGEFSICFGNTF